MYVEFEVANFWRCIYNIDVCSDFFFRFFQQVLSLRKN
jgi:hypothetical protein